MKYITYLAIFVLLMTPVAMASQLDMALANKGDNPPIVIGAIGHAVAALIVIVVIAVIVGLGTCAGAPQGGGGTSMGVQECIDDCVANGGDDFDCMDRCM